MPFCILHWTEESLQHIAEHGVTQDEFTEVVMDTGIDRAQLSRLLSESGVVGNLTIQTLERLAAACDKRVVLSLQDAL